MVHWAHPSPQTNGISIGFTSFCSAHNRDRPTDTDRQTDHAALSVTAACTYVVDLPRCDL